MTQNWMEKMRHSEKNRFRQQLSVRTFRRQVLGLNDQGLCLGHTRISPTGQDRPDSMARKAEVPLKSSMEMMVYNALASSDLGLSLSLNPMTVACVCGKYPRWK